MKIQYLGSRNHMAVRYRRNSIYFTRDNERMIETFDQDIVDAVSKLSNSHQFRFLVGQPVEQVAEPVKVEEVKVEEVKVEPIKEKEVEDKKPKAKAKGVKNVKK